MVAKSKPNEIYIERVYDAPVKTVWDAWVDPKQAGKWWGPRGFTITTHSKDFRVGGNWRYTMHGPDGVDYPNTTLYHEIIPYKRMVYDHGGNDDRPPLFRVTVLFSEVKGKTKMEMTMALESAEAAANTRKFIKQAGGNSTWDRLAEYLDKETKDKETFVINRSFDAPIDRIYEMWTNPKHFSKWLPPVGFTMELTNSEIQEGKSIDYSLSGQGVKMYGRIKYLEIKKPSHILYTQQFTDDKGNVSRHPFAPFWPETMLTKVVFTEEDPNQTRVTIEWECHGKTTQAELEVFIKEKGGMTQGWTGSFDKLEDYLKTAQ